MKSIFFRIYSGIIIGAILVGSVAYIALQHINKYRYENYLVETIGGTFSLMSAGVVRHEGPKRQEWINVIERLTGISLEVSTLDNLEDYTLYTLNKDDHLIYIQTDTTNQRARIALPIPGSDDQFVLSKLNDINQTVARMTALLILNELGRHPKNNRREVLGSLDQRFGYDLTLKSPNKMPLHKSQLRQLVRGDIVINLSDTSSSAPFINVYAKYGNSGLVLSLGPIMIFQWYPIEWVLLMASIALIILFICGYILVHPIEKKLNTLESGINNVGASLAASIEMGGSDAFSRMAASINSMVQRIKTLVEQQQQLTNDISHELRTPVARLLFRVENIILDTDLNESNNDIVGMKKDINNLNRMIDEILTSAKLEHPQQFKKHNFDITGAVSEVVCELTLQHPEINFRLQTDKPKIMLYAEEVMLLRAIENLLLNACRYCKEAVAISLFSDNDELKVHVEDDGLGIPEEERDSIFNPFIRLDKSRNRSLGGFGLGLSIVQKVASLHQGSVKAGTSLSLGGAMVSMNLPFFHKQEGMSSRCLPYESKT